MQFRKILLIAFFAFAALCVAGTNGLNSQDANHRGRKYKAPPPTSTVTVTILRASDEKPLENASVVFQLVGDKGNMELKTNEEGKATIDVLPTGSKVLLQVLAKGYQTYGKNYDIDKENLSIEVKMKRPAKPYSIYEKHDAGGSDGSGGNSSSNSGQKDASQPGADSAQPKK
jgi:hypothetical protein